VVKIKLRETVHCDQRHWMLNEGWRTVIAEKTVEVPSIEAVKFVHTQVNKGLFSDTTRTFDAVRYGDDVYALSFDTKTGEWVGEKESYSPSQSMYCVDYVSDAFAAANAKGFKVVMATGPRGK